MTEFMNLKTLRSLVPDKSLNLKVLPGEQDAQTPVSYNEWSRDAEDFIKSRGGGRHIVGIMEWSERMGKTPVIDKAIEALGLPKDTMRTMCHDLYMCIKNWTSHHAKTVVQNGVHNGFDAWKTHAGSSAICSRQEKDTHDRVHEPKNLAKLGTR